ncbi:P-loop containing nucleoside triphosphate hydrolase protein [Xylaria grammica]|nr:P-loop containing nucleoside triphosphate hydrolase protein [Xylaria grammica]
MYKYTDPRYALSGSQVWGADFIQNKGEGQIFLLHGGPGVGKTFVKCLAEFAGRPLLALTCGDIGTDEVAMERELGKWLKLAHKWGAVMLIDEADVFLEKRMEADLKRNSLVSVFLREIEYYQGILFLTTNRVGQFDDAFISRIHVVIHYPDLREAEQKKIWNQFFDKLEEERKGAMEVGKETRRYVLEEMCTQKWNGREIRNAFQTAVALAEYRFLTKAIKEDDEIAALEDSDFKQVCDMTIEFKSYLTDVHNEDEFQRAGTRKLRAYDE